MMPSTSAKDPLDPRTHLPAFAMALTRALRTLIGLANREVAPTTRHRVRRALH